MNLHNSYNFQKIWAISNKELKNNLSFFELIPDEWQLILTSDGSFTQNLISLTGKVIYLDLITQSKLKIVKNNTQVREIWLIDSSYNKLAFAQSIWPIYYNYNSINNMLQPANKPIGQQIIESKLDIYKDIHDIYYGYSSYLENKFLFSGPTWGRKYTIYYKSKPLTTIEEIFSPKIIHLFTR